MLDFCELFFSQQLLAGVWSKQPKQCLRCQKSRESGKVLEKSDFYYKEAALEKNIYKCYDDGSFDKMLTTLTQEPEVCL